jgi:hypothetical protein
MTRAFARRQRTAEGDDVDAEAETADEKKSERAKTEPDPPKSEAKSERIPAIDPPDPRGEPWPDATPEPMAPVARSRVETLAMPISDTPVGKPPEMPTTTAPPRPQLGDVENPAHMPGPREIPAGNPGDPAPAPGRVPPGDSRSLRRAHDFALVYRVGTYVISRFGVMGTRGQWRVVEYPTLAAASHAYAKECSRFVSEGFADYRA